MQWPWAWLSESLSQTGGLWPLTFHEAQRSSSLKQPAVWTDLVDLCMYAQMVGKEWRMVEMGWLAWWGLLSYLRGDASMLSSFFHKPEPVWSCGPGAARGYHWVARGTNLGKLHQPIEGDGTKLRVSLRSKRLRTMVHPALCSQPRTSFSPEPLNIVWKYFNMF